jgi:uncharacterized membrane protein
VEHRRLSANSKGNPMPLWFVLILMVLTLANALIGGVFLAFSDFIMRALRSTSGTGGVEAMQIINREVFYWIFMVLFIGLVPIWLGLLWYTSTTLTGPGAILLQAAAVSYLVGAFGVTVARNVPMNTMLGNMDLAADSTLQYWVTHYVPNWTFWNSVRTGASILASGLCLTGLVFLLTA